MCTQFLGYRNLSYQLKDAVFLLHIFALRDAFDLVHLILMKWRKRESGNLSCCYLLALAVGNGLIQVIDFRRLIRSHRSFYGY
jgi:hypothetical protein